MLTQVYELRITQLHILSINFIIVLSNYRCIRYLVFPALFPSTSMVFSDYTRQFLASKLELKGLVKPKTASSTRSTLHLSRLNISFQCIEELIQYIEL